ncbi:MAG TPA: hypothetical protein VFE57_08605, partial [Cyclobacteriaceae bacterium]|nr:hypothetical protein [Cyclobacteriaceae bacterium]
MNNQSKKLFYGVVKSLFALSFICITTLFAFSQDPNIAPQSNSAPQPFTARQSTAGDALGNSINLYTGDVAFPVGLASLPGRNGLDVTLSISYSSNVHKEANTWNNEAPTGVIGLGWSFDFPKILTDNKMTGSREDDTYYLSEGNSVNELVYISVSSGVKEYKPKSHQFWIIKYYPTEDKWEITKEDGTKFIYGDKDSGRSTIQSIVKWNNWIGNSSNTSNQVLQTFIWNLSEIKNLWGESIR